MQDNPDDRAPPDIRTGIGPGAIAAIAAVVVIIGALFLWAPRDGDTTASNTSPGTTTGQSTRTAPPPAAPAPEKARQ
jgi:hypothetical protein